MIKRYAIPVFAALSLLCAGAANAQPAGGGGGGVREACQADFQKFCADVQPGGGARMQCMKQHAAQISDGCKAAIAARRKEHQEQQSGGAGAPNP
jgi:arylformamidase